MITLNQTNGDLTIGDLRVLPDFTRSSITRLAKKFHVLKGVENGGYAYFRIPEIEDGEFALSFLFFDEKLISLNIELGKKHDFPPFTITSKEKRVLESLLEKLGGPQSLAWGSIALNEDFKGGTISITVKYV